MPTLPAVVTVILGPPSLTKKYKLSLLMVPSHPQLLDHLAARFIAGGWSIKAMHRLILLSSVYQQSTRAGAAKPQMGHARGSCRNAGQCSRPK